MPEATSAVRPTRAEGIPALIALHRRAIPTSRPLPSTSSGISWRSFPRVNLRWSWAALPAGNAGSLIVSWDEWAGPHTWKEITASGTFDNSNPEGHTLYGAEVFVDPDLRGRGLGHLLYEGRKALCRAMNLKSIIACGRLPAYH